MDSRLKCGHNKIVFIAFDVQVSGLGLGALILSIGVAVGNKKGEVLEKHAFCFGHTAALACNEETEEGEFLKYFDGHYWSAYWLKRQELLRNIQANAKDADAAWVDFRDFLDSFYERYSKDHVVLLFDEPHLFLSSVDHQLYVRFGRFPVCATKDGAVNCVWTPAERLASMGCAKRVYEALESATEKCEESPAEEASSLLLMNFMQMEATEKIKNMLSEAGAFIESIAD